MNICSVILRTRPERLSAVLHRLQAISGVEVHGGTEAGRLIVTVDTPTLGEMSETVSRLSDLEGVLGASLVYHYSEQEEAT